MVSFSILNSSRGRKTLLFGDGIFEPFEPIFELVTIWRIFAPQVTIFSLCSYIFGGQLLICGRIVWLNIQKLIYKSPSIFNPCMGSVLKDLKSVNLVTKLHFHY